MEESNGPHTTDRNMQFNIGKALGLKQQTTSIEQYREQLKTINGEFETQADKITKAYTGKLTTIENDLKAKQLAMQKDCLDTVKDIETLKNELTKVLDDELRKNQLLYPEIEKICQAAVQRFQQKISQVEKIDDVFIKRLEETADALTSLKTDAAAALATYLSTLLNRQADFEEMECGYWYGEAVRLAQGESTQDETK